MKAKQIEKLKMFVNLSTFMAKNNKVWHGITEIDKALKKFSENISRMEELKAQIETDLNEEKENKKQSRSNLVSDVVPIVNVLRAFALDSKDASLLKKVQKNKTGKLKDIKLIEHCKEIIKKSKKIYDISILGSDKNKMPDIRNFGLSNLMIDKLKELNQAFVEARTAYCDAKNQKEKYFNEFKQLQKKNNQILKNKIDLLITVFEPIEPEFYKNYQKSRTIEKSKKVKSVQKKKTGIQEKVVEPEKPVKAVNTENQKASVIKKTTTVKRKPPVRKTQQKPVVRTRKSPVKKTVEKNPATVIHEEKNPAE